MPPLILTSPFSYLPTMYCMSFLSPLPSAYANLSFLPSVFYYSTLFLPSMPHFLPFLSCPFLLSLLSFLSSCIPLLLSWLSYFDSLPSFVPYLFFAFSCFSLYLFLTSKLLHVQQNFSVFWRILTFLCKNRPKNYLTTVLAQQVYCMFQIQLFWSFSNSEYRNVLSSYNSCMVY